MVSGGRPATTVIRGTWSLAAAAALNAGWVITVRTSW